MFARLYRTLKVNPSGKTINNSRMKNLPCYDMAMGQVLNLLANRTYCLNCFCCYPLGCYTTLSVGTVSFHSINSSQNFCLVLYILDHFSHLSALNQITTLCNQIQSDCRNLHNHKYMAHQVALLYVSFSGKLKGECGQRKNRNVAT